MSPAPRIRTLKPENWQDERVGRLSRDARLLRDVLITMADDEGRLRDSAASILGHGYPYDEDAPKKLARWLGELIDSGMILRYQHDDFSYLAFRRWKRHQKINRPRASVLPPPPDREVVVANSVDDHDSFTEIAMKAMGNAH